LVLQEQELSRHRGREVVVDDPAHEHDAISEETRVDVVGALAAPVVDDDRGYQCHVSYLLGSKPMRGRAFGGGLAMAMYALKSATLRSASRVRPAVASRSF